jgi:uncharacterized protein (TIGR04222 family)
MLDSFEAIPGFTFAAFYFILCAVAVILSWNWGVPRAPWATPSLIELPMDQDPYFAAWLSGQKPRLIQTALFSLVQKNAVVYETDVKSMGRRGAPRDASSLEKALYAAIDAVPTSTPSEWSKDAAVQRALQDMEAHYKSLLEQHDLLANGEPHRRAVLALAAPTLGLGVFRLTMAVYLGRHNIGFLTVMLLVASGLFAASACRTVVLNGRGQGYLASLKARNSSTAKPSLVLSGEEVLLASGLFGVSILADTQYAFLTKLDYVPGGGGGCGGGGCGGGGCGGGGCGG